MKQYLRKQYSAHRSFTIADIENATLLSHPSDRRDDFLIRKVLAFILQKKNITPQTSFDFDIFYFVTATVIMLLDERDTPLL